jgi:hypothetical protein
MAIPVESYTPKERLILERLTELVAPLEDNILLEPLAFSFRDYDEMEKNRKAVIQSVTSSVKTSGKTLDDEIKSAALLPSTIKSRKVLRRLLLLKKIIVEEDPDSTLQQIIKQRTAIQEELKALKEQEAKRTTMG